MLQKYFFNLGMYLNLGEGGREEKEVLGGN